MKDKESKNAKFLAISLAKRFREMAIWDLTRGNRVKTNERDVFALAAEFRRLVDRGESLQELENAIFRKQMINGVWKDPLDNDLVFSEGEIIPGQG